MADLSGLTLPRSTAHRVHGKFLGTTAAGKSCRQLDFRVHTDVPAVRSEAQRASCVESNHQSSGVAVQIARMHGPNRVA